MGIEDRTLSLVAGTGGVVKGKAVKLSGSTLVLCSDPADSAIGIAMYDASAGEMAGAILAGEAEVLCDAALTVGGRVGTDKHQTAIRTQIVQMRAQRRVFE